ncbi:hypothetical protein E2562_000512 [Oryza meyeriana var. granulata]|uniref:Uncharacterized protein n=1 Tax=Oryza meyeriana var. granulata TaxID=110450 RepID=A0A6G1CDG3_9ORYZ|nr:hypothetical protein E2562_000512 [Oryza meyeriana var. granulata]
MAVRCTGGAASAVHDAVERAARLVRVGPRRFFFRRRRGMAERAELYGVLPGEGGRSISGGRCGERGRSGEARLSSGGARRG